MDDRQRLRDLAVSDTGFVFDPRGGATFSVNATGKVVLEGLKQGLNREGLIELLNSTFETTGMDLHRDINIFGRLLREHQLVGDDFSLEGSTEEGGE